jgi:hypothetical protein
MRLEMWMAKKETVAMFWTDLMKMEINILEFESRYAVAKHQVPKHH